MIDFIIAAKSKSTRVPNKNWRPFHNELCLVDINIQKLISAGIAPESIYVSCDDAAIAMPVVERWGVEFIRRDSELCENHVSLTKCMREIAAQVPGQNNIGWCHVVDPLFDEYRACIDQFEKNDGHDSLVVAHAWKGHLMTPSGQPIGWSFGEHHTISQHLPAFMTMPFCFSILTRSCIKEFGYYVGKTPYWFQSHGHHVDINTELDFATAQHAYKATSAYFETKTNQ